MRLHNSFFHNTGDYTLVSITERRHAGKGMTPLGFLLCVGGRNEPSS